MGPRWGAGYGFGHSAPSFGSRGRADLGGNAHDRKKAKGRKEKGKRVAILPRPRFVFLSSSVSRRLHGQRSRSSDVSYATLRYYVGQNGRCLGIMFENSHPCADAYTLIRTTHVSTLTRRRGRNALRIENPSLSRNLILV